MNRRSLLKGIGAALGLAIADPAEALWKPGKLISIPKTVTPMVAVDHIHTFSYDFLMNGNDRALSEVEFLNRFMTPGRKYLEAQLKAAGLEKAEVIEPVSIIPQGMVYHRRYTDGRGNYYQLVAGYNATVGDFGRVQTQVKTKEFVPRVDNIVSMHSANQRPAGLIREWKGRV